MAPKSSQPGKPSSPPAPNNPTPGPKVQGAPGDQHWGPHAHRHQDSELSWTRSPCCGQPWPWHLILRQARTCQVSPTWPSGRQVE